MSDIILVLAMSAMTVEILSYTVYARDILSRRARPSRASWLVWAPLCWLTVASNWQAGADLTLIKLVAMCFGVTLVAILAIRFGTGGCSWLDRLCMGLTLLGVLAWIETHDPTTALLLFILADLSAAMPTIDDAARQPDKDSRAAWSLGLLASALNLMVVEPQHWTLSWSGFGIWGFNVYLFLLNGLVAGLMLRPLLRPIFAAHEPLS